MIVITGGAGFIGSCILARFNELRREDIIVVDHLNHPLKQKNLEGKRYSRYYDKEEFLKLIMGNRLKFSIDQIIHMGACSSTVLEDAPYFERNNFEYSCQIAGWAIRHEVRLIYASSAATYGDGTLGYKDTDDATRLCRPLNLYGGSKQKFDEWVLKRLPSESFMVGLKFFNVFGPNEYHKGDMRSVAAKAYPQVVGEGKLRLFKSYKSEYRNGDQRRDFIYVKDAVKIVMYFFQNRNLSGIYNAGTGQARTWNDLAHAVFHALKKEPHVEYIEMPEYLRPRYQYSTQANMTKLRQCGYTQPFTSLEEGVRDYVEYLKEERHL